MPDWTYRTVFRPVLFRLPTTVGRDLALAAIGTVARLPWGRRVIEFMGHMRPARPLRRRLGAVEIDAPVGLAPGIDPRLLGLPGLWQLSQTGTGTATCSSTHPISTAQSRQGLTCLRKIRPLFSRLRKVGVERDKAGNRRLFMDQSCVLVLMALFSPAIQSVRDRQRACTLDRVRKWLGVNRLSLGSPSESAAIFDPAPLTEIAAEPGHTIRSRPDRRFDAVSRRITAVDGTVIETVKRGPELSWAAQAKGNHLSAYPRRGKQLRLPVVGQDPGHGPAWQRPDESRSCRTRDQR